MHNKSMLMAALAMLVAGGSLLANGTKEESKAKQAQDESGVTVYATSSFCGDWGPGPKLAKEFEAKTGIKVNLVDAGSTGEMLTRLIAEKEAPVADVVMGISDNLAPRIYDAGILASYDAPALKEIPDFLEFDPQDRLLPYDYGNFAFVYDSEKLAPEDIPHSLDDLLDPKYAKKVILIDPRTSAVGMGLLEWTIEVYGEDHWLDWWKQMEPNTLTIASGWSSGYGLFTEGEAPLAISYTTSPVYHVMFDKTTRYQALIFDEGHNTTVEGLGLIKGAKHQAAGKSLIDFVLTDAQLDIAETDSMYPANASVKLPDAFDYAPKPEKNLFMDADVLAKKQNEWLDAWEKAMGNK
ncbi:MAG: thiamine ABC transporter substrate binding subunit [Sphaerochaetaceae bacterium]|nr:thiamine ABC transporter substrate binding subunit [Spirochaetales bacterium]MDY5498564.1 thiamine ABC transporter substrate binding subunit [Sphaerochaetaceae bacterium]